MGHHSGWRSCPPKERAPLCSTPRMDPIWNVQLNLTTPIGKTFVPLAREGPIKNLRVRALIGIFWPLPLPKRKGYFPIGGSPDIICTFHMGPTHIQSAAGTCFLWWPSPPTTMMPLLSTPVLSLILSVPFWRAPGWVLACSSFGCIILFIIIILILGGSGCHPLG